MPASLLGLGVAVAFTAFAGTDHQLAQLRGDVISALAYVANWRFVWTDHSYAELFVAPSPVLHYWTLAIEEQFYAFFPLVVAGSMALTAGSRRGLGVSLSLLAMGSVGMTLGLFYSGASSDRIYFGTDARAAEFAVGGLLAVLLHGRIGTRLPGVGAAGVVALALALFFVFSGVVDISTLNVYRGGLTGFAVISAIVIAAAVQPSGPVRSLLGWTPLRELGKISYGVYVFHWPVFLWLDSETTGLGPAALFAARMSVVLALSLVSYRWIEQPIRSGRRLTQWRIWAVGPATALALVAVLLVVTTDAPTSPLDLTGDPTLNATRDAAIDSEIDDTTLTIAVFGDSTALALSKGLFQWFRSTRSGKPVAGITTVGCGLADRGMYRFLGKSRGVTLGCGRLDQKWADSATKARPDLSVVLLGHWDLHDRRLPRDRKWRQPGDPVFDEYLRGEIETAVDLLSASGTAVVWLTIPELRARFEKGNKVDDIEPAKIARYNELLREVETSRPEKVRVVDLAAHVKTLDAVAVERLIPDGIHMTGTSAFELTESWLGAELIEVAEERRR
jgi:peptidoglycan/LPS O-acetylase OafA/YrhL